MVIVVMGIAQVTRFTTDLDSKLTCYTDDNALLIQKRLIPTNL